MPLSAGTRLGPYEILSAIGAGGMGEVYRAKDTKLGRAVAIKVLPEDLARDPERMARFEREAKVLASLNHPNIAQIYGVEGRSLVMELVEGGTLKGPLPVETALDYARQIAEAVEAAHEKGIIHRDLKPANIMITPAGVVKVLDFGLAAVAEVSASQAGDPTHSPTLTISPTRAGVILGTAAYMSPEQARGKTVDTRADIWAFGVVLYEMLTGQHLFKGETISDTLAAVLKEEPDWDRVPAKAQRLLRRCLEKDPKRRLRAIGDAMPLLEDAPQGVPASRSKLSWAVAAAFALIALALGFVSYRHVTEEKRVFQFSVLPPEKATFAPDVPAISPDGRRLVFVVRSGSQTSLWVRDLDSLAAKPLPGTEGGQRPFWSPDSHFVAFFADGKLKKVDFSGGPALILCESPAVFGGSWSNTDVILFTPRLGGLFRVPAAGGTPTPVTDFDARSEAVHVNPWFLPDGRHFLYLVVSTDFKNFASYVGELDSKIRRQVLTGTNAEYAPPGYLLFARGPTLMAQRFDAGKAQTTGDPVPITEQIGHPRDGPALFSTSQNGILVYESNSAEENAQLTWFDRSGKAGGTVGLPGFQRVQAISPDGATVAGERQDPNGGWDIWLHDMAHGSDSRFTFGPYMVSPVWSPDSSHIAFMSLRDGGTHVYQKATSGAAQDEVLDRDVRVKFPTDWSRDGRFIIEGVHDPKTGRDIWVLPLFGDRKPFPYLHTEFNEGNPKVSPNVKWLAYESDESKRNEVYVQTFPNPTRKWQISTNGGCCPAWSRDGKELFFISADQKMMAVEIKGGLNFDWGAPRALFDVRIASDVNFEVGKDGRFLIPVPVEQAGGRPINVVVNWTAGLKK